MHLESKFTMSLVFVTTFFCCCFFFGGGGGGYSVTWLSRPILSLKFLDPEVMSMSISTSNHIFIISYLFFCQII